MIIFRGHQPVLAGIGEREALHADGERVPPQDFRPTVSGVNGGQQEY